MSSQLQPVTAARSSWRGLSQYVHFMFSGVLEFLTCLQTTYHKIPECLVELFIGSNRIRKRRRSRSN